MKKPTSSSRALKKARSQYIQAQIGFEKGLAGFARKLRLPGSQLPKQDQAFSAAQQNYYQELDRFRELTIRSFTRSKRRLNQEDVKLITQVTVFEEIETLREEKEKYLRSQGLAGIIRSQVQEWRQISPNFKIILGLVLLVSGVAMSLISVIEIKWIQVLVVAWGMMIFLEGAQQKATRHKAARQGKNRFYLFKKSLARLPQANKELGRKLAALHRRLEKEIWGLRIFEKRTEYRRYLIATLTGLAVGALFFVPYGVKVAAVSTVTAIFSRMIWFLLPYGAIRSGISGIFKTPVAEAAALDAAQAGEGSDVLEQSSASAAVSRASLSDPVFQSIFDSGIRDYSSIFDRIDKNRIDDVAIGAPVAQSSSYSRSNTSSNDETASSSSPAITLASYSANDQQDTEQSKSKSIFENTEKKSSIKHDTSQTTGRSFELTAQNTKTANQAGNEETQTNDPNLLTQGGSESGNGRSLLNLEQEGILSLASDQGRDSFFSKGMNEIERATTIDELEELAENFEQKAKDYNAETNNYPNFARTQALLGDASSLYDSLAKAAQDQINALKSAQADPPSQTATDPVSEQTTTTQPVSESVSRSGSPQVTTESPVEQVNEYDLDSPQNVGILDDTGELHAWDGLGSSSKNSGSFGTPELGSKNINNSGGKAAAQNQPTSSEQATGRTEATKVSDMSSLNPLTGSYTAKDPKTGKQYTGNLYDEKKAAAAQEKEQAANQGQTTGRQEVTSIRDMDYFDPFSGDYGKTNPETGQKTTGNYYDEKKAAEDSSPGAGTGAGQAGGSNQGDANRGGESGGQGGGSAGGGGGHDNGGDAVGGGPGADR